MGKIVSTDNKRNAEHPIALNHCVFVVWEPSYNLGIPIIDEQHRGIVSTINSFHFGMQNNYVRDMLTPIIDMIYDYTRIHFQIEEDFLEMIDYPHAQRHHELHEELSVKLNNTGRISMLDKDPYQFMDFLKNWWINHICSEDLIFRDYLISSVK